MSGAQDTTRPYRVVLQRPDGEVESCTFETLKEANAFIRSVAWKWYEFYELGELKHQGRF